MVLFIPGNQLDLTESSYTIDVDMTKSCGTSLRCWMWIGKEKKREANTDTICEKRLINSRTKVVRRTSLLTRSMVWSS